MQKKESDLFISVVILNTNAKKDVRVILEKLKKIDYPKSRYEIIIVDNNSTDGSREMLEKVYPDVLVVKLKRNYGIPGFNYGIMKANGAYILTLDDDAYIEPSGFKKAIKEFHKDENVSILACNIIDPFSRQSEYKYLPQDKKKSMSWIDFIGSGGIFKKSLFEEIGYFNEDIFIYGHEVDFSLRTLNAGYSIRYAPNIKIFRTVSQTKMNAFRMSLGASNFPKIFWRYLSFPLALQLTVSMLIEYFIIAVMTHTLTAYIVGIRTLIHDFRDNLKKRTPIRRDIQIYWSSQYPFTLANFIRRLLGRYSVNYN